MPKIGRFTALAFATALLLAAVYEQAAMSADLQEQDQIRIFGLVERPLTLSRAEMLSMPTASETANLLCIIPGPNVTYTWTGVPLFHLLTLAGVKPSAFKVAFRASDGFSADLLVEEALRPTTLVGLGVNGGGLPNINGISGLFRMVVPCKYGYKWVGNLKEIEVVDYDYKGTYESSGFSDQADIIDCPQPSLNPPVQAFGVRFGNRTFEIDAFTNATITDFEFDQTQKEARLNVTVPQGAKGFIDLIIPQSLLIGPFSAFSNQTSVELLEANVTERTYMYASLTEGNQTVRFVGAEFSGLFPTIVVEYNRQVHVGEVVAFDASGSMDDGEIVSYEWGFGDGATGSGPAVTHAYTKDGDYTATLNVTDNDGLSRLATFLVQVRTPPEYVVALQVLTAAAIVISTMLAIIALASKKKPMPEKNMDTGEQASGNESMQ